MQENIVIKPITIGEQLLYNTVRIMGIETQSVGTGSFHKFPVGDNKFIELIVTNKHVIGNNKKFSFFLHELDPTSQENVHQTVSGPNYLSDKFNRPSK